MTEARPGVTTGEFDEIGVVLVRTACRDLPWNPAVLEQRIGRVHRLGQSQPVQVINFIAQGTIEEGMLSVLTFKKALFAGVLDGGEREVFLGGSRLSRFMETVEKTTTAIGQSADIGRDGVREAKPHAKTEPGTVVPATRRAHGPASGVPSAAGALRAPSGWAAVVQTGVALLEQLAAASRAAPDG